MASPVIQQVLHWPNLVQAWEKVADNQGSAGPDRVSIKRFARNWEENLRRICELVAQRRYKPGGLRRVAILKRSGGMRVLRIPNVGDRVLQRAALNVLERTIDRTFLPCSYGYRPKRGVQQAVAAILALREADNTWVVDADIDDCFDSLDHHLLADLLKARVQDERLLNLVSQWIDVGCIAHQPRRGLAQGMPISPLLCNLYLHEMDRALIQGRWNLVRYADDFVICCRTRSEAETALEVTAAILESMRLRLEPRKTSVTSFNTGFDFLGVRFQGDSCRFLYREMEIETNLAGLRQVWNQIPDDYL